MRRNTFLTKSNTGTGNIISVILGALILAACGGSDGTDGTNGINGTSAAIQTGIEPAGANCANGGVKIEVLQDGVVQEDQTQYICNGNNGENGQGSSGGNSTIRTSDEPAGENCANGGIKIEILMDGQVQGEQTKYICHQISGTNGTSAAIQTSIEPAGQNCASGGIKVEVLLDGAVQDAQTQYICNGHTACASGLKWAEEIGKCLSNKSIYIPSGTFVMTHGTRAYPSGGTLQMTGFGLGKTPVTVAEFKKCVAAGECTSGHYNSYSSSSSGALYCNYNRGNDWLNHPMNCVDWHGAKEYCSWIGGRLPTEEEWEYASTHDGTQHLNTKYAMGNTLNHCVNAQYRVSDNYCQGNAAAVKPNGVLDGTGDVLLHTPAGDSPLGLVDMTGNVWEWTESLYSSTDSNRTIKGGSWSAPDSWLDVSSRNDNTPTIKSDGIGFRCAE